MRRRAFWRQARDCSVKASERIQVFYREIGSQRDTSTVIKDATESIQTLGAFGTLQTNDETGLLAELMAQRTRRDSPNHMSLTLLTPRNIQRPVRETKRTVRTHEWAVYSQSLSVLISVELYMISPKTHLRDRQSEPYPSEKVSVRAPTSVAMPTRLHLLMLLQTHPAPNRSPDHR